MKYTYLAVNTCIYYVLTIVKYEISISMKFVARDWALNSNCNSMELNTHFDEIDCNS